MGNKPCRAMGQHQRWGTHLHCVDLEADGLGTHTDVVGDHIGDEKISHKMFAWRGRLGENHAVDQPRSLHKNTATNPHTFLLITEP